MIRARNDSGEYRVVGVPRLAGIPGLRCARLRCAGPGIEWLDCQVGDVLIHRDPSPEPRPYAVRGIDRGIRYTVTAEDLAMGYLAVGEYEGRTGPIIHAVFLREPRRIQRGAADRAPIYEVTP